MRSASGTISQKGDTAKAINYALNQWAALTLYVHDGAVEIDNNAAERARNKFDKSRCASKVWLLTKDRSKPTHEREVAYAASCPLIEVIVWYFRLKNPQYAANQGISTRV